MTLRSPRLVRLLVSLTCVAVLAAGCSSAGASPTPGSPRASLLPPASGGPSAARPSAVPSAGGPSAAAASAGTGSAACPTAAPAPLAAGETRTVTIETIKGTIVIKVDGSLAPNAAGNFVALAACGFYDRVTFHRLVPNFVIQGGDPTASGSGGPGYTIEDQEVKGEYKRGTLAMARTPEPNSQGSQFFIVLSDDPAGPILESYRTYAIFGEVVSGMEAVDAIAAMPNSGDNSGNQALDPVAMDKVTVTTP